MNFATPAAVLLFLFLPGVVARFSYARGNWAQHPFRYGSITEEIAYGSFASLLIHAAMTQVAAAFGRPVSYEHVVSLAFGPAAGNATFNDSVSLLARDIKWVTYYFIGAFMLAWICGYFGHRFVRWGRVDLQSPLFRFKHDWHYLFSGQIVDFLKMSGPFESDSYDAVLVAVAMELKEGTYLYRGLLSGYYFDKDGQLDRLVLEGPERAKLLNVERAESRRKDPNDVFHAIDGRFFVIYVREIENINVQYLTLNEKASGTPEA